MAPNVSELLTTTLFYETGEVADNVTKNNALLTRLKKKGNIKPVSGGTVLRENLDYQENPSFKRYSGYETLDLSIGEVLTAAEYNWKQCAVAVQMSGLEMLQNSDSKERLIDLLEARITNAKRTLTNNVATDLYSDGTASGGKQIGGLQYLVSSTPTTGTVGGISRDTWTFWQNQVYAALTSGGAVCSAANIITYLNRLQLKMTRGTDHPDLATTDNNFYEFLLSACQARQIMTASDMADLGFDAIKMRGVDYICDGNIGGGCPASTLYMLNTNFIKWRPHKDRNFVPLDPDRFATNQDAVVKLIALAGNLTMSGAEFQGVLINT